MIKILVTGSRDWTRALRIATALENVVKELNVEPSEVLVIHGAAPGADEMAGYIAEELGMRVDSNPAHWRHTEDCPLDCREMVGKPAGVIRNQKMLDKHPEIQFALAFHPNLTKSRGTADMVRRLKKAGIEYKHIK